MEMKVRNNFSLMGKTHEEGCIGKLWASKDVGSWRMYIPNTCGHAKSSSNDDDTYSQMNHQEIIIFGDSFVPIYVSIIIRSYGKLELL
jgi:hypothetical protein